VVIVREKTNKKQEKNEKKQQQQLPLATKFRGAANNEICGGN